MNDEGFAVLAVLILGLLTGYGFRDLTSIDQSKVRDQKEFIHYKASYKCQLTNELKEEK